MYHLLQNDPAKLQQVKEMLQTTNPQMAQVKRRALFFSSFDLTFLFYYFLYKLIDIDPQGFLELLSQAAQHDAGGSQNDNSSPPSENPVPQTNAVANNDNPNQNPSTITVTLSQREQEIIDRVCIYSISIEKNEFLKGSNLT